VETIEIIYVEYFQGVLKVNDKNEDKTNEEVSHKWTKQKSSTQKLHQAMDFESRFPVW